MTTIRSKVVGMVAGERLHVVAHVATGDPVLLVPEPSNPHDPNAIAVHTAPRSVVEGRPDPDGPGWNLTDADRRLLMDRQAGYVPATTARLFDLPPDGIAGTVADVRFPPDYEPNSDRPVGFDVRFDVHHSQRRSYP